MSCTQYTTRHGQKFSIFFEFGGKKKRSLSSSKSKDFGRISMHTKSTKTNRKDKTNYLWIFCLDLYNSCKGKSGFFGFVKNLREALEEQGKLLTSKILFLTVGL